MPSCSNLSSSVKIRVSVIGSRHSKIGLGLRVIGSPKGSDFYQNGLPYLNCIL